jgi:release factor glutamine methyltransferase
VDFRKSKVKENKDRILDIGTGCIAISLAKNLPNATFFLLMFLKALATAKECQNKCCKRHFYQSKHS